MNIIHFPVRPTLKVQTPKDAGSKHVLVDAVYNNASVQNKKEKWHQENVSKKWQHKKNNLTEFYILDTGLTWQGLRKTLLSYSGLIKVKRENLSYYPPNKQPERAWANYRTIEQSQRDKAIHPLFSED